MQPTTFSEATLNSYGANLAALTREQLLIHSRIDSIGGEMRETVGMIAEIAEAKLKIISNLLATPEAERDFDQANGTFQIFIKKFVSENIESYQSLLDARKQVMEDGLMTELTKEKKLDLLTNFSLFINNKVQQLELNANKSTDLERLRKNLKEDLELQLLTYNHLLDAKSDVTMTLDLVQSKQICVKKAREHLFIRHPTNIWQAAEFGDLDFIKEKINECWFWEVKDFVNKKDKNHQTALSLASTHGEYECVKFLLDNKAEVNISDNLGYTPLHWAAKEGFLNIAVELVQSKAFVNCLGEYNRTPLHFAAFSGHDHIIEFLLKNGASINAQVDEEGGKLTALHTAIMQEGLLVILALANCPTLNVNLLDSKGRSPLLYAIRAGRSDVAAIIVAHPSWKRPVDPNDINHLSQLHKIIPDRNAEQIGKFLKRCS